MEMSTPLVDVHSRDVRRQTIFKNPIDISPLKRRSLAPHTSMVMLENTNDERERSVNRSMADIQRRLSSIPRNFSPTNDSYKFLGEKDMMDHFRVCVKLFTENKITAKNVWNLHIIDIFKQMANKPGPNVLEVAGTSLEISTKVYSIRVDDIHSEGLKLASSLSSVPEREAPQHIDGADENQNNTGASTSTGAKKKKQKRLLGGEKSTICKDPKSITLEVLPKLESVVFSARTDIESCAIDNLFTNRLKMDHSGTTFMLLSNEKAWTEDPDPVVHNPNKKKYPFKIDFVKNLKLCKPFSDFCLNDWNPEEEEKQIASQESTFMEVEKDKRVVFDDNGIPVHELDGSIHDIFDDPQDNMDGDDNNNIRSVQEEALPQITGEIANIVELRPEVTASTSSQPRSEYTYNSLVPTSSGGLIDQVWAGPSHWKLKFIRRVTSKFSGQKVQKKRRARKRKREPKNICFELESDYDDLLSRCKVMSKKCRSKDPKKLTVLLRDTPFAKMMEEMNKLMSKPTAYPVPKEVLKEKSVDCEAGEYQYENPNDSLYCSQEREDNANDDNVSHAVDHDQAGDQDNHECQEVEEQCMAQQAFLGDNLVDAPEEVPKTYVPYALQAKKMDMKKLKAALWQSLTNTAIDLRGNGQAQVRRVIPTTFSKLWKDLPELLPSKMKKELTCSLVFVALLELCNKQNLTLKQHPGNKDFDIVGLPDS